MYEKLSEKSIRQEKVQKLKSQLMAQILNQLNLHAETLRTEPFEASSLFFRDEINEIHALFALKDYLSDNDTFMHVLSIYTDKDVIVYEMSIETLDWMLQEESLLSSILFHIKKTGWDAPHLLCDKFFEYEVFGIMDRIAWDNRRTHQ